METHILHAFVSLPFPQTPSHSFETQKRWRRRCARDTSAPCQALTCEMRREFLMKQRVEVIYTGDSGPLKVQPKEQPHLFLSMRLKSGCCLQRWTMMYVLLFSFG